MFQRNKNQKTQFRPMKSIAHCTMYNIHGDVVEYLLGIGHREHLE